MSLTEEIILLDLFSGTGGFAKGLLDAGVKLKAHFFSEIDKYAVANYEYNFKEAKNLGDVTRIKGKEIPRPDLITFGSPCQDISVAGKGKGLEGKRSRLFFEAVRLIAECRPRTFIFENVKGLFSSNKGKDFEAVLKAFAHIGLYDLEWQLLNTRWFLPQNRERIYLVGHLRGESGRTVFPIGQSTGLSEAGIQTGQNNPAVASAITRNYHKGVLGRGETFVKEKPDTLEIKSVAIRSRNYRGEPGKLEIRSDANANQLTSVQKDSMVLLRELTTGTSQQDRIYESKNGLARTLKSSGGTKTGKTGLYKVNKRIRRLTPVECERLQGFPDGWTAQGMFEGELKPLSDTQRYILLGNAVSVPVVKAIALRLFSKHTISTNKTSLNGMPKKKITSTEPKLKTPITYYGGKQSLLKHLLPLVPQHRIYCEPFFGGGAFFFAKPKSEVEVINDLNGEVINFFKVLKNNFAALQKEIRATLHSRESYYNAMVVYDNPHLFSEVKRAWALWTTTNQGFSSMIGSWGFGKSVSKERAVALKRENFEKTYSERLRTVQIENNNALKVIERCDAKDCFLYCDPPYIGSDMGHYAGYTEADYKQLLDKLAAFKGKFLLSSYPSSILSTYIKKHKWRVRRVEKYVAVTKLTDKKKTEMLVFNYEPPEQNPDIPISEKPKLSIKQITSKLKKLRIAAS